MTERKAISKRLRFEVLKRDAFTCQYCGKQPPDTVLHMDHINPVSNGGKNTLLNLITSCAECNLGKSDKLLSDDSAVKKQQKQMQDLAEKKAQIKMMIEWRESLISADELLTDSAVKLINQYLEGYSVSKIGRDDVKKSIKKNGYQSVIDAIEKCFSISVGSEDFRKKWGKAIQFCSSSNKVTINYAKGILRNRGIRINDRQFHAEFPSAGLNETQIKHLVEHSKSCSSIYDFRRAYDEVMNG